MSDYHFDNSTINNSLRWANGPDFFTPAATEEDCFGFANFDFISLANSASPAAADSPSLLHFPDGYPQRLAAMLECETYPESDTDFPSPGRVQREVWGTTMEAQDAGAPANLGYSVPTGPATSFHSTARAEENGAHAAPSPASDDTPAVAPAKRKRSSRSKAPQVDSVPTTIPPPAPTPVARAAPTAPPTPPANPVSFDILLQVTTPSPTRTRSGARTGRPNVESRGNVTLRTDQNWLHLTTSVADTLNTTPRCLRTETWEWKALKGTSPAVPLRNENDLAILFRHIKDMKQNAKMICLIMKNPKPPVNSTAVDEYESDGQSEAEQPAPKKGRIDKDIETIYQKLLTLYPVGGCAEHETISCFHDTTSKMHFNISERARGLSWAAHIHNRRAGEERPPIGSGLFSKHHALATGRSAPAPRSADLSPPSATSSLPRMGGPPPSYALSQSIHGGHIPPPLQPYGYPPMYYPPPGLTPYAFPSHPPPGFPPTSQPASSTDYSSAGPPSSPVMAPADGVPSLKEFCEKYGLDDRDEERLRMLDFRVGMSLSLVPKQEIEEVGFKTLGWQRVTAACKQYKLSLRN